MPVFNIEVLDSQINEIANHNGWPSDAIKTHIQAAAQEWVDEELRQIRREKVMAQAEIAELQSLLTRLAEHQKEPFSSLLKDICDTLGWNDLTAASSLDTSTPIINRWLSGEVVPPALALVIKFLTQDVQTRLSKLQEPS